MIPFQVDRFGLCESRDIEGLVVLGIAAPAKVYYGSIQLGPLDTRARRSLVRSLIEELVEMNHRPVLVLGRLSRRDPVSASIADPADFFVQSVDTERWLVGRVALVFEGQRPEQYEERTVIVPNADGEDLDVVAWGLHALGRWDSLLLLAQTHAPD
jgi:hypothetical protein